ncbi:hypothetical protein [Klebsiella aerogenes]|uniref:hypothetical protein n=1 Tax=Klebsiella aerogenes TaxID=548 RepID=UPI002433FE0E|nr:hypothetical protein [Klebsiella aerogenes]WFV97639.1 hypothetical protein NFJ54_16880 [Klebsiella aerogenes]
MRVFLCPHKTLRNGRSGLFAAKQSSATRKTDRAHSRALAAREPDIINLSVTKTALHRTRLRVLDHKNFSVLFFYKPDRQTAPVLAAYRKSKTEKIEKNFRFFQCWIERSNG